MSDTHDMDCERALKNLEAFVDRELPESDQERVEQHLRICRECCSRVEFESRLKERLSTLSSGDAPSKMRDRVRELIRRF